MRQMLLFNIESFSGKYIYWTEVVLYDGYPYFNMVEVITGG